MRLKQEGRGAVNIQGLDFAFGTREVFKDFDLQAGSRIVLLRGPSGCGKTSLLKLLFGLLTPQVCARLDRPQPAFLLLQQDALVPWFSGAQNIAKFSTKLWAEVKGNPLYGMIEPFLDQKASEMSFGQRRSIELVRALSVAPPLLLLDEPFNFLDAEKRHTFIEYINSMGSDRPNTMIVMTSHYAERIPLEGAETFDFVGEMPHRRLQGSGVKS
jgi:ABC-type nitrate/sulfonate/bicarbonate transport system ATPase subunit